VWFWSSFLFFVFFIADFDLISLFIFSICDFDHPFFSILLHCWYWTVFPFSSDPSLILIIISSCDLLHCWFRSFFFFSFSFSLLLILIMLLFSSSLWLIWSSLLFLIFSFAVFDRASLFHLLR
jgi:hypothetical protein